MKWHNENEIPSLEPWTDFQTWRPTTNNYTTSTWLQTAQIHVKEQFITFSAGGQCDYPIGTCTGVNDPCPPGDERSRCPQYDSDCPSGINHCCCHITSKLTIVIEGVCNRTASLLTLRRTCSIGVNRFWLVGFSVFYQKRKQTNKQNKKPSQLVWMNNAFNQVRAWLKTIGSVRWHVSECQL